jgi:phenylalanyl-tRNA synthetase beta chain
MRLLVSWLRDFVDVPASPAAIAESLAVRGFEVASIEEAPDASGVPWQAAAAPDAIIDFEITANRPDCLSVLGLAREVATAYDIPLRAPSADPDAAIRLTYTPTGEATRLTVALEDADLCPRYAAAVADVTMGASPGWMAARLIAAGIRPISAVVDVTNYVLLELGQPMHAFDLASLRGAALHVRRARSGETLTTLDGIERTLDSEMLVIADAERAQAIAGVMGGAASEVSPATRTVALESAHFHPASVRRTSKSLGLKTEASARFERGTDINAPVLALERAIWLMEHVGVGRVSEPVIDRFPRKRHPVRVHLRRARLALLLGTAVPDQDVDRILRRLDLGVTSADDGWDVIVPTFRVDLRREADLIEEVGRHYGFDRLAPTFPAVTAPAPAADPRIGRDRLARRVLTAAGLSEATTFGFVEGRVAQAYAPESDGARLVRVDNPLSAKFDTLRPSLIPGLIDSIGHNRRHGRRDVGLFEIGARFLTTTGETRAVGIACTGAASPEHWSNHGREIDFFDIKGVAERLCDALGTPVRFEPAREPFLVDGRAAAVLAATGSNAGARLGIVGEMAPPVAELHGLSGQDRLLVAELDLDAMWTARARLDEGDQAITPLPRYPSVVRDLSIVVPDTLPAEIIRGTIQAASTGAVAPLAAIGFFDRYQGKSVPEGSASVSVRLTFQATDRTLTESEVQKSFDAILTALVRDHGAVQR